MSSSMISTVLDIEREAEAILGKAGKDAAVILEKAKAQRGDDGKAYFDGIKEEVAALEVRAGAERAKKVKELESAGEAALSAVRNISDAAFDNGVNYVMKVLAGE